MCTHVHKHLGNKPNFPPIYQLFDAKDQVISLVEFHGFSLPCSLFLLSFFNLGEQLQFIPELKYIQSQFHSFLVDSFHKSGKAFLALVRWSDAACTEWEGGYNGVGCSRRES